MVPLITPTTDPLSIQRSMLMVFGSATTFRYSPVPQEANILGSENFQSKLHATKKVTEEMPKIKKGLSFMVQIEFEALSILPYNNKHGQPIGDHAELSPETKVGLPLLNLLS